MIDLVTIGETMISLVPRVSDNVRYGTEFIMRIAGAESNTAIGVQKLGHTAGWIGRIGNDDFGQYVLRMIRAEGVDTSQVTTDREHQTGIMFKGFSQAFGSYVNYYRDLSAASFMEPSVIHEKYIANARILHLTGITPLLSSSCYKTLRYATGIAKAGRTLISFDPNIRFKLWKEQDHSDMLKEFISLSDILLIGLEEADYLFHENDVDKLVKLLFSSYSLQYIAIKDGKNGAWVSDQKATHYIPPVKCRSIDSIGAGDAFNAGFLSGLLEGRDLEICGKMGGISGAHATESTGDIEGLLSKNDMADILNNNKIHFLSR